MKRLLLVLCLILVASATTAYFLLKPPPPPVGVPRFRPTGSKGTGLQTTPYSGNFTLPMTLQYAGPPGGYEWATQTWVHGKATPISARAQEELVEGNTEALFSIRDRRYDGGLYYGVGYSTRRSHFLGGSGSGSGTITENIPDQSSPWIVVVSPRGPVDVPEGPRVPILGIVGHHEPLQLPPETPLEVWASRADWAILVGVQRTR